MGNMQAVRPDDDPMRDPRLQRAVMRLARLTGCAWACGLGVLGSFAALMIGVGLGDWGSAALLEFGVLAGCVGLFEAGAQKVRAQAWSLSELLQHMRMLARATCVYVCRDTHPQLLLLTRIVAGDRRDVLAAVPPTEVRLWGLTPLMWAAWAGQAPLCEVLMRLGADDLAIAMPPGLGLSTLRGLTASEIALRCGRFEAFDVLRLRLWRPLPSIREWDDA